MPIYRNGCDCHNYQPPFAATAVEYDNGCEFCNDSGYGSPCAYVALFGCEYYTNEVPMSSRERYAMPCLVLRKDCPSGCTYSSRWRGEGLCDAPVLTWGGCISRSTSCTECRLVECFDLDITDFQLITTDPFSGGTLTLSGIPTNNPVVLSRGIGGDCTYRGVAEISCTVTIGSEVITSCPVTIALAFQDDGQALMSLSYGGSLAAQFYLDGITCSGGTVQGGNKITSPSSSYIYGTLTPHDGNCPRPPVEIDGWQGGCTWISQDCDDCFTKWSLSITSATEATLTVVTRNGYTATYATSAFQCYARSTFVLSYSDPKLYGLPHCICIAPLNVAINDPNCSQSFCDDGALTRSWTHNDGYVCDVLAIPAGDYVYPRGPDLPPEVGDGDSLGRCNYFWRTFDYTSDVDCTQWSPGFSGLVGVLILAGDADKVGCTASPSDPNTPDRSVEYQFWCYDFDLELWVYQGSQCGLYYCCDPSISPIEFTADCCCEPIPTVDECGCTGIPTVLTVSDGTNSFDLTYSGGTWLVTPGVGTTFAGCTFTSGVGRSIALQCFGGSTWYFAVDDGGGGLPITCAPTGMCSPFALSCTITGCDSNTYTIDITI